MGPQQKLEIYVGFDFSSIIRYFESLISDVFIAAWWIAILMKVFSYLKGEKPDAFIDIKESDKVTCPGFKYSSTD